MTNDLSIVGFTVGAETFGVAIQTVHEIVRMMDITAVPGSHDYFQGVINLRGKVIPVVDLRKRFGEPEIKVSRKNRILIAEICGKMVGLVVDAASEVLKIPPAQIEPPPNIFEDGELNYVTGVAKTGNRLIILVDLSKIMQRGELKRLKDQQLQAS